MTGATITASATDPLTSTGTLWFNTVEGRTYLKYNDQWVDVNPTIVPPPETYLGGPDPLLSGSAYGEGKRVSEWLASQAAGYDLEVKVARIFALVGPHLPLDKHFAIGNFIRAAQANEEIVIQGDGTPHRSYLYAADMAAWLWAVLFRGECGRAYNVGSDESISIAALAKRVCYVLKREPRVDLKQQPQPEVAISHYVPDITRARSELGMPPPMPLDLAILRTVHMLHRNPWADIS
ncbi:MAG: NAD-dependent epimerase/dehydratase family protein [Chitinophagia bacterium]|nr:NAD-dependent epimerase/dehydratase family protein [Chitinophagia bacterium]